MKALVTQVIGAEDRIICRVVQLASDSDSRTCHLKTIVRLSGSVTLRVLVCEDMSECGTLLDTVF